MRYAVAILVRLVSLSVGIYGWRGTRSMLRSGEASLLFDLRRLFGGRANSYRRGEHAGPFWITVLLNVFVSTICTGFALGVLFLVFASIAARSL